jgi:putative aldouronate transport system permease protein
MVREEKAGMSRKKLSFSGKFDTRGEKVFYFFNYIFMLLFGFATLLPFLNVLAKSLSSKDAVLAGTVGIIPKGFQIQTYKFVVTNSQFLNSLKITLFITLIGSFLAMVLTVMSAYPLARSNLKGRKIIMMFFVFTMLFGGGMIPNYILINTLKLYNKVWSLILPSLISVYNMILVKNYLEELPAEIEEAARIDGASELKIMVRIILPMALPVMATVGLFYAVAFWNSYFNAIMYISKPELKPLPLYLYELLKQSSTLDAIIGTADAETAMNIMPETLRAATIMVSTLPILCAYPLLQRYFVKGITVGSVKG